MCYPKRGKKDDDHSLTLPSKYMISLILHIYTISQLVSMILSCSFIAKFHKFNPMLKQIKEHNWPIRRMVFYSHFLQNCQVEMFIELTNPTLTLTLIPTFKSFIKSTHQTKFYIYKCFQTFMSE